MNATQVAFWLRFGLALLALPSLAAEPDNCSTSTNRQAAAPPAPRPPYRLQLAKCGQWPGHARGHLSAIEVVDHYVVAALQGTGLVTYRISPEGRLAQLAVCPVGGSVWGLCVANGYAFVAVDPKGVVIVDVREPAAPVEVGRISGVSGAQSIDVNGGIAAIPVGTTGVQLVRVADPHNPVDLGVCKTWERPTSVALADGRLFLTTDHLECWAIADPSRPRKLGDYFLTNRAHAVKVAGHWAFVAMGDGQLLTFDVRNPAHIELRGGIGGKAFGYPTKLCLTKDRAILGGSDLCIVDVSDPANPRVIKTMPDRWNYAIAAGRDWLVAGGWSGLTVFAMDDPTHPLQRDAIPMAGIVGDIWIERHYAYLADGIGLVVLDISNPCSPRQVALAETPGFAESVWVSGQRAYVSDSNCPDGPPRPGWFGLQIFDISNPRSPVRLNQTSVFNGHTHANQVFISGKWAYVVDNAVIAVDTSNPAFPKVHRLTNPPRISSPRNAQFKDGRLYVTPWQSETLSIYEFNGAEPPILLGKCPAEPFAQCLAVEPPYALVGDEIMDVSQPHTPRKIGVLSSTKRISSGQFVHDRLYVADEEGIRVFDLKTPEAPRPIGQIALKGRRKKIRVAGNHIYVASWTDLIVLSCKDL